MSGSDRGPRLISERSDDADVARLLGLAGPRPAVPVADAEVVRRAARAEWRRTVRAQRLRTWAYRGAGGLLAAACALLVLRIDDFRPSGPDPAAPVATVERVTGRVSAANGDDPRGELVLAQKLSPGTVIDTPPASAGAAPARLALRLAGGTSLRLDAGSRLRLVSAGVLALDRGAVYADSGAVAAAGSVEIRTPWGVAADVGTQFEVRVDERAATLVIRVREGAVILTRDGESYAVGAGAELRVSPDGPPARAEVACRGPQWEWVLDVLPPFESGGRSLRALLEWAARESCWRLDYAPGLEREAETVILGSRTFGRQSPSNAVAGAFQAAPGLAYRLQDGVLRIERGP